MNELDVVHGDLEVEEIIVGLLRNQDQAYARYPDVSAEKVTEALRGIIEISLKPIDEA